VSRHVFVSYSHEDAASYVRQLGVFLAEHGIPAWFDKEVVTGLRQSTEIEEQIRTCAVFVIVMTRAASQSARISNEVNLANQLGKPIVPLLLDGDVFVGLNHLQYQDVHGGSMPVATFINTVRGLLAQTTTEHPHRRPMPPGRPRSARIALIAGGTALAILAGVGVVSWLSNAPNVKGTAPEGGGQLRIYTNRAGVVDANRDRRQFRPSTSFARFIAALSYNRTRVTRNDLAESITTADNINWTIKIKPGYRFTNGSRSTLYAFIRSWNYGIRTERTEECVFRRARFSASPTCHMARIPMATGRSTHGLP
jgi:hypothetical protein